MMTLNKKYAIGFYSQYMSYLWEITSGETFPDIVEIPNEAWNEYINSLWIGHNQSIPEKKINTNLIPLSNKTQKEKVNNKVVIGFSGGKDSLVVALRMQEEGFTPIMFHVKGLTRSTGYTESLASREIALKNNWEYIEEKISYNGKTNYLESPVRNHLVLSYMIDYMINNNITNAGIGLEIEDKVFNTSFEERKDNGFSDGVDFTQLFIKAIKNTFQDFTLYGAIGSKVSGTIWLFDKYKDIAMESNSCMLADRVKEYTRNKKMVKFGIHKLPKYNCLCCKKCCQDYLILYKANILGDMVADDMENATKSCYKTIRNKLKSLMGKNKKELKNVKDDDLINYIIKDYKKYIDSYKINKKSVENDLKLFIIETNKIVYLN